MANRAGHLATCGLLAALIVGVAGSPPLPGNEAVCACHVDLDNPSGEVLDSLTDTLDDWKEQRERREGVERDCGIAGERNNPPTLVMRSRCDA